MFTCNDSLDFSISFGGYNSTHGNFFPHSLFREISEVQILALPFFAVSFSVI